MASAAPTIWQRGAAWWRHAVPTRESLSRNRLLRPVAHHVLAPSLWRFNRRSVPRGVAVGIATSVLVPVAHMPAAAILSVPLRANLPTAVAVTVPSTLLIPPIWLAAHWIGARVLRVDRVVPGRPLVHSVKAGQGWLHWLFTQAGPATIVGLFVIAAVGAALGYFAAQLGWRLRVARKWRTRRDKGLRRQKD